MKVACLVAVLSLVAAPVLAGPVHYILDVDPAGSSITLSAFFGLVTAGSPLDGTFDVIIYQSDGHIGASETFIMTPADVVNTQEIILNFSPFIGVAGLVPAGNLHLTAFEVGVGHVPGGTYPTAVHVDIFGLAFVTPAGTGTTTLLSNVLDGSLNFSIPSSLVASQTLVVNIAGSIPLFISDVGLTIDLILDITGTAHVVPDPALGGLTALGLAGAGAWLRRRRG